MATRTAGGEGVDLAAMVTDESPADAVNIKLMRRRPPPGDIGRPPGISAAVLRLTSVPDRACR